MTDAADVVLCLASNTVPSADFIDEGKQKARHQLKQSTAFFFSSNNFLPVDHIIADTRVSFLNRIGDLKIQRLGMVPTPIKKKWKWKEACADQQQVDWNWMLLYLGAQYDHV